LDLSYDNYGIESELSSAVNAIPTNRFYVDSAIGIDASGIGSIANPYKKVSVAVATSISGDTILVGKGTYLDNIILTKKLTIIAQNTQANTIIKPLLPNTQIFNFTGGSNDSKLSGFTLSGGGNVRGSAIDCNFSSPIIENCIITKSAGEAPIHFYYTDAIINNCLIYKNTANSVFFYDPNDKVPTINHSTIVYNTGIGTGSSNIANIPVFTNCIIYGNTGGSTGGNISILNSIVQGGYLGNETNINSNPYFIDSTIDDYHLQNYSPAIGLGSNSLSISKDFEGSNRIIPNSSNPDAGAFESVYDHSSPLIISDSSIDGVIMFKVAQVPSGTVNKFSIYRGLTTLPTSKYLDTTLINRYVDNSNTDYNKIIYYRLTSTGTSNIASGYSNQLRTIAFTPPSLNFPTDLSVKADTNINFQWEKIDNATKYKIQYSTDSNFVTNVVELSKTDTSHLKTSLVDNTSYFWRLQTLDTVHYSMWSNHKRFQTFVRKPVLASITSTNKSITLSWTVNSIRNIKSFKIYKGTATNPTTKVDSISSSNLSYNDPIENGNIFYYRVTAINTDNIESDYSNEKFANSFGITVLTSPVNNNTKESLTPSFKWDAINLATLNNIQISTDSLFISTPVIDTITSLNTYTYYKGLIDNSTYYWRVRIGDSKGYGNWTTRNTFQTLVLSPKLLSIQTGNKVDTLKWSVVNSNNLKYFKIYSDTINNPTKLKDSISGALSTYIDKTNLQLNIKYYYRIIAGNQQNIESDYSNILAATPINTLPKAVKLANKTVQNSGEYNFVKLSYSGSGSYDLDGSIASYNWYVNDSLVNSKDSILSYFFKLGSSTIKLVVVDNDGGKDTSSSILNLTALQKQFQSGILGGISAINQNYILTADTSYNSITGSSVSLLDRLGNTIIPIVVQSKIFTTPSVSSDSSIFITNGSSLNGYSKAGVSLWPTIPLGGISYVTPTIDSNLSRIYVGVSNKNFFAYDYKTGKNVWSIICDAPINTSAVISGDRKLIFTSQTGTLYGFDISKSDVQTTPKWKMSFGDIITKSPAVDASSNIYVGTDAGRLIKFMLNTDGSVSVKWNVTLSSSIQTSPIIDADSNIYVGTEKGDFYKIDRSNGSTIWSYNTGAAIHSTPNISEYGTIYVPNMNGLVTAITTNKRVLWKYQDNAAISANSLYINNMLYIASEKGTFTGIYDNPNSVNVNTSFASSDKSSITSFGSASSSNSMSFPSMLDNSNSNPKSIFTSDALPTVLARTPVWGTFQGDYRRTGTLSIVCPSNLTISKDSTGSLISNTSNYIQWYKDGTAITNASSPTYKPSNAGSYSVKNNQVGCNSISSNSYYFIVTDVINISSDEYVKVNPNPISSNVNFDFKVKGYQRFNLDIYSVSNGDKISSKQNIYSGEQISVGSLSSGVYLFRLTSSDNKLSYQFKMIKL
jgi:outer membrane protein assembly factor BamB